jgi:hypothetical protein
MLRIAAELDIGSGMTGRLLSPNLSTSHFCELGIVKRLDY